MAGVKVPLQIVIDESGVKWVIEADGRRRHWYPSNWIALDFMEDGNNEDPHPYISGFLAQPWLKNVRSNPNWRSVLNHSHLKKEVTESWGVVLRLQRLVNEQLQKGNKVTIFDMCSGKGLTGSCVAGLFPNVRVRLMDRNPKMKMFHLKDLPNADWTRLDFRDQEGLKNWIREGLGMSPVDPQQTESAWALRSGQTQRWKAKHQKQAMTSLIPAESGSLESNASAVATPEQAPVVGIIVGVHLCGPLAEQFIELFNSEPNLISMILCPCCLPGQKGSRVVEKSQKLERVVSGYVFWSLHLLMSVRKDFRRTMETDELVESEKNCFILSSKQPPSH